MDASPPPLARGPAGAVGADGLWRVPRATSPLRGAFEVPPSKSVHQRALVLATLAEGASSIEAAGDPGDDVLRLAAALSLLSGRPVAPTGTVEGAFGTSGLGRSRASLRLDLGMNATGLRLLCALACLRPSGARTLLTGAPRLRARPTRPLLRALARLGAHVRRRPTGAVRAIGGGLRPGRVAMRADVSSQFASALCLAAPRFGGVGVALVGEPVSSGYLALTVGVLRTFGVEAVARGREVTVPGTPPRAARVRVEGDASSAAVWWAAAAATGGDARTPSVPGLSAQPDLALLPVLARMGASVAASPGGEEGVRVRGPDDARPVLRAPGEVDLRHAPDLAPLVGALGALAEGETRVVGAPQLRLKESDRVATVVAAARAIGAEAEPRPDGFVVRGPARRGGVVDAAGDHRVVLAFAVAGLVVPVAIRGARAVAKSWPGFPDALARALAASPDGAA
jgi:3-phosphoshikimate 1-carboxyvinyltransferase